MNLSNLYLIKKESLAYYLFATGILIAYMGSLNPWFMWKIGVLYVFPASFCIMASVYVCYTMRNRIFTRTDYIIPIVTYILFSYYLLLVQETNIKGFISHICNVVIFSSLFIVDKSILAKTCTFLCKSMAWLLVFSIPFYLLYLIGFNLPSTDATYGDNLYSYTNYFFFMVDDRSLGIFPRFHSVFLEPGHLGTAAILLLLSQLGKWRKWYNIVLWVATFMTFSLAAYVLAVVVLFLNTWVHRRRIIVKLLVTIAIMASIVGGSFIYNNGENLINELIVLRLEVDDEGELVGDNRVLGWFESEYESYLQSSDVFFGRDYDYSITGNSGYRVFIYENGFVGLFLCIAFYLSFLVSATDRRVLLSVALIATLCFIVRGYPLWYCFFIPMFTLATSWDYLRKNNDSDNPNIDSVVTVKNTKGGEPSC